MSYDVVVAGHLCLDVIPALTAGIEALKPGRLLVAGPALVATGGAVPNVGIALHKLGVRTRLAAKIGNDMFGAAVREVVERQGEGLADGLVVAPAEATSYTIVISMPGADRMFLHAPGCNDTFCADDLDEELLRGAKLMHFGYPPLMKRMHEHDGAELVRLLRKAKACGVTTSLDLSFPDPESPAGKADWRTILGRALPLVDIFMPSVEELVFMLRRPDYDRLAKSGEVAQSLREDSLFGLASEALDLGAKVVLLKAGTRGVFLRSREAIAEFGRVVLDRSAWQGLRLHEPCFSVDVVGTTGSGDTTIAGFLAAVLRGMAPEKCLEAATAVGACCCEAPDAVGGLRPWADTQARIEAGWPKLKG